MKIDPINRGLLTDLILMKNKENQLSHDFIKYSKVPYKRFVRKYILENFLKINPLIYTISAFWMIYLTKQNIVQSCHDLRDIFFRTTILSLISHKIVSRKLYLCHTEAMQIGIWKSIVHDLMYFRSISIIQRSSVRNPHSHTRIPRFASFVKLSRKLTIVSLNDYQVF